MFIELESALQLRFRDGARVATKELYYAWLHHVISDRGNLAESWTTDQPVVAQINHGRWIASCINCDTGMMTHPEWRLACCADCGTIHTNVIVPADYALITAELLKRPKRMNQNWQPHETLEDLQCENAAHGV